MSDILYNPTKTEIKNSNAFDFIQKINNFYNLNIKNWQELYEFSTDNYQEFWSFFLEYSEVIYSGDKNPIIENENDFLKSKFFPNIKLNFAKNLLKNSFKKNDEAIVFWCEDKIKTKLTHAELIEKVSSFANYLKSIGVGKGDRVAVMLPNLPETIIIMLATTSVGGVFSSTSPDFGTNGVLDRFEQIKPKLFVGVDGYFYNGKEYSCLDKNQEIAKKLQSKYVLVNLLDKQNALTNFENFAEIITKYKTKKLAFVEVNFNDPLYIMFSSGTTGKPKCIVHSVGGTLLQHKKEHLLHADIKPNDRVFYFTTCGWMMWNWLISSLSVGAKIMLYDGSPLPKRKLDILFEYANYEKFTHMGVSAKYLEALDKFAVKPKTNYKLENLGAILSTGSVLSPNSFNFVYKNIKKDLFLMSISGGTDIVSCFVLGSKMLPIKKGYLQTRGLGMAVEIFDDAGKKIENTEGELVCTKPFPSKPIYFWGDENNAKYFDAYFNKYPNIWHHGDYAKITGDKQIIFFGRSDATLNPGGVRIGTAEIYNQIEKIPEILEAVVVGKKQGDDEVVVLFVVLKNNLKLSDDFIKNIQNQIGKNTTPRHIPNLVYQVEDIPKTRSGKVSEIAVKKIINGKKLDNLEALSNANCLIEFEKFIF
jgi:acetoacetyl-CoA synthetase